VTVSAAIILMAAMTTIATLRPSILAALGDAPVPAMADTVLPTEELP
jgi:hypothetical protein